MDPLSLAVGVTTVAQVASKSISVAVAYGKSIQSLPVEVQALVSEISLLSGVLNKLDSVLHDAANEKSVIPTAFGKDFLQPTMEECHKQLETLHSFLENGRGRRARIKNLGRRLKWPMKEQQTREWIKRMERFKGSFSLAVQLEDLGARGKLCGDVEEIKVAQEADRVEKKMVKQSDKYRAALAWLSDVDPKLNHTFAQKLQQSGTGRWFVESKEFRDWKTAESSFMWLYGIAGSGKTILSSIIIDCLMEENTEKTIYFYCDFKDAQKTSITGICRSLAAQVLESNWENDMPPEFESYYEKNKAKPPHESTLREELLKLFGKIGRTRILVDALDECSPSVRGDVLKMLWEIQQKGKTNILVTSREEVDIKHIVDGLDMPKVCVKINPILTSGDIALFVAEHIERNAKLSRLKVSTKEEVATTITSRANGMFRWAKCSLDHIAQLRNDRTIKQALKTLPPDLNETYDRILDMISNLDKEMAMRIFNWLACSFQPMLIQEIVEGIGLEFGATNLDADSLLNDPEHLIDVCGSLVTVDQYTGTVGLAHFSVKEYLTSRHLQYGNRSVYFVDVMRTNFRLARLCVTYLCFEDFNSGPCATNEEYESRVIKHRLYLYAAKFWPQHAQEHIDMNDHKFLSTMERFFLDPTTSGNFIFWMQAYDWTKTKLQNYLAADAEGNNRLVYACRLGLYSTAHHLLSKGLDPNAVCTAAKNARSMLRAPCGNSLNAACESGNLKVVELLVTHGANINAIAGEHGLALNAAIAHAEVNGFAALKYLLERGADINLCTPEQNFPLQEATHIRSPEAVKICIAAGADLGMRSENENTMTEIAATFGYAEIFETLWEHGGGNFIHPEMPWNLTPGVDGYSLNLAAQSNFFEISNKILKKDGERIFADPSFRELMHLTFRSCASNGFYKFIQQMLVYSGTEGEFYIAALQEAAVKGNVKTVEVLLDARKEWGVPGNPLVLAAAKGYQKVVDRLLERGEDPAAVNIDGWSAMLAASVSKQHGVLEAFKTVGKTLENSKSAPMEPRAWQVSTDMTSTIAPPVLELDGWSVFSLPENKHNYILYFDHPIPPRASGWYYFELSILEVAKSSRFRTQIGLVSALAPYDYGDQILSSHCELAERNLSYSNSGSIRGITAYSGAPSFSAGSVIGCAVNLHKELAYFTCDGEVINVACEGVKGMLYSVVYISPGTRVKANLGEEKFLFDVGRLNEVEQKIDGQKVVFCPDDKRNWHEDMMRHWDKRYVG
ncbi:hypothetical protein BDD12DRAFT_886666 [Trichophaea hybrida]|nr:hypothetical protein BDD12DRAFT_886666 [Trichophaea hybrida]